MRLVFLGTPSAAVPFLRALVDGGHDVRLVVSRADKRRGRNEPPSPSPVKEAARALDLPVTDRVDDVIGTEAELGVVVAFGRLVKPPVLERVPMVNVHFSLLPRWRGAAPVERAILAGDATTGVCVMRLEEELDTGPVYARAAVPILPHETADELRARLVEHGVPLLVELLRQPLPEPQPQDGEPTYAPKLSPEELRLDWAKPAVDLERVVRVGGAWTTFRGKRLKVWRARATGAGPAPGVIDGLVVGTGRGGLELVEVQAEGRSAQTAAAWRNGARLEPAERLGE